MRAARLLFAACLLMAMPEMQGAIISIDATCYTDLAEGGSITQTFSTRRSVPTMGGCSVGTVPDSFPGLVDEFASSEGFVDFDFLSGEFMSTGGVVLMADYPVDNLSGDSETLSRATISFALNIMALSLGSQRQGLIELESIISDLSYTGINFALVDLQVGSILVSTDTGGGMSGTFPFVLGEVFPVHIGIEANATDTGFYAYGYQDAFWTLNFRLTELDGSPVSVELAVPEASTFILIASGLGLLALRRSHHRRRRSR